MTVLLTIHSITRWLVTLTAIALIVRLVIGLIKKQPFDKSARALTGAFSGLMDTQMLLGILFFVLDGLGKTGFPPYRWEHAVTMFLAVVVAHLPAMWKNKSDAVRTRNTLIAVVVSLLLVFTGIGPLGGWTRWWHIRGLF
jgi:Flp pilus assembly pilin Flp